VDAGIAFYRSAQPLPAGFRYLHDSLSVSNVVKMNGGHGDKCATALGMNVISVPISTWKQLFGGVGQDITNAVRAIKPGTVLHCQHGNDRTGLAIACYRVWVQGWPKAAAQKEMLDDGFHPMLRGLWDFWQALR
jgi:protein tyrosine/serine phosphatase